MARITEIRGNLFESTTQTLVNTVNCYGVMGKGIALEFKNRFPEMYSIYSDYCDQKIIQPGILQIWNKSNPWILNFPTKKHWRNPSKIEYIESGLKKFAENYLEKGISSIAFPQLGCSLGGLQWENEVKPLMYQHLEPLKNLDVEIYEYDPNAKDSLYEKLYQSIHRLEVPDYQKHIGLTKKQSEHVYESIHSGSIQSMLDLQKINGIGEKALEKIYSFVNGTQLKTIKTGDEIQLSFL